MVRGFLREPLAAGAVFLERKNQRTLKRRTSFSVQTFALQGIKHRLCRTWKEMRACEAFTFVQTTKCVCTGIVQPRRSLGRKGAFGRCESKIVRKSVAHICASYTQVTDLDFCSIRLCGDCIRTSPVPEICTSLRSTTNYGKISFWGSAKLGSWHSPWEIR